MGKTAKTATRPGVQDSPLEASSPSTITPKIRGQKEQPNSPLVEVLKSNALDHLSSNERDILERQLSMPPVEVSYTMLYRYATKTDTFMLIVSAICAIASGAVMPLMTVCTIVW